METPSVAGGFTDDVRRAARAWRGSPVIPTLYVLTGLVYGAVVAATPTPPDHCDRAVFRRCPLTPEQSARQLAFALLALPFSIFAIGLAGTARVWYLQRFEGRQLSHGVWWMSWQFWPRFFLLGLVLVLFALPFSVLTVVALASDHQTLFLLLAIVGGFVVDVLFTFITPGLALYNPDVWESVKGGLRILRSAWPTNAPYALIPPLALTLLGRQGVGQGLPRAVGFVMAAAGPPLTLLFAGATVSFLLRRYPPMSDIGTLSPWRRAPYYAS